MKFSKSLTLQDLLPAGVSPDMAYMTLAAAAAFFTVYAVGSSLVVRDPLGSRIKSLHARRAELKKEALAPGRSRMHSAASLSFMRQVVDRLGVLHSSKKQDIADMLASAGMRDKDALIVFMFLKIVGPVVGALLAPLLVEIDFSNLAAAGWKLALPLLGGWLGYVLPTILLVNRRTKRWHEIRKSLPDVLDLMMVCAEAGLTLSASLDRVAREIGQAYPEAADELTLTSIEIGFLPERRTALEHFQKRVGLPEIRGMVSVLLQTEKYGTPVAQALRTLSSEFRQQRLLRAEQKAARLPAIMTVPMIVFILPCLFIVMMTPALIQLLDEMSK